MKNRNALKHYSDGERVCSICKDLIPAHEEWPGSRQRNCGKPACAAAMRKYSWSRLIGTYEQKCAAPTCGTYLLEGVYDDRARYLVCSAKCYLECVVVKCACGCGKEFIRANNLPTQSGLYFASPAHFGNYQMEQYLAASCGSFREIADQYLNGYATLHYRNLKSMRSRLVPLFEFLGERGIESLEEVKPSTITEYMRWLRDSNREASNTSLAVIAVFFDWALLDGHRESGNPVVPKFHRQPRRKCQPRPYKDGDLKFIDRLLTERGNSRLRFAAALGEESGMRIGEICNLRLEDMDVPRRRAFVRLPNKTNTERWTFFSEKTTRYYEEWMKVRDPNCGHSYLLHNSLGTQLQSGALRYEFKKTLCKQFEGKPVNDVGLDRFSMHRLRHTMASRLAEAGADMATVMAAGGWKDFDSAAGYTEISEARARRGYDEAMRRAREQKDGCPCTTVLTPAEFLKKRQNGDAVKPVGPRSERKPLKGKAL